MDRRGFFGRLFGAVVASATVPVFHYEDIAQATNPHWQARPQLPHPHNQPSIAWYANLDTISPRRQRRVVDI